MQLKQCCQQFANWHFLQKKLPTPIQKTTLEQIIELATLRRNCRCCNLPGDHFWNIDADGHWQLPKQEYNRFLHQLIWFGFHLAWRTKIQPFSSTCFLIGKRPWNLFDDLLQCRQPFRPSEPFVMLQILHWSRCVLFDPTERKIGISPFFVRNLMKIS